MDAQLIMKYENSRKIAEKNNLIVEVFSGRGEITISSISREDEVYYVCKTIDEVLIFLHGYQQAMKVVARKKLLKGE